MVYVEKEVLPPFHEGAKSGTHVFLRGSPEYYDPLGDQDPPPLEAEVEGSNPKDVIAGLNAKFLKRYPGFMGSFNGEVFFVHATQGKLVDIWGNLSVNPPQYYVGGIDRFVKVTVRGTSAPRNDGSVGALHSSVSLAEIPLWEARYGSKARHLSYANGEGGQASMEAVLDTSRVLQEARFESGGDPFVAEAIASPDLFCRAVLKIGGEIFTGRSLLCILSHVNPKHMSHRRPVLRHPLWYQVTSNTLILGQHKKLFFDYIRGQELTNPCGRPYQGVPKDMTLAWLAEREGTYFREFESIFTVISALDAELELASILPWADYFKLALANGSQGGFYESMVRIQRAVSENSTHGSETSRARRFASLGKLKALITLTKEAKSAAVNTHVGLLNKPHSCSEIWTQALEGVDNQDISLPGDRKGPTGKLLGALLDYFTQIIHRGRGSLEAEFSKLSASAPGSKILRELRLRYIPNSKGSGLVSSREGGQGLEHSLKALSEAVHDPNARLDPHAILRKNLDNEGRSRELINAGTMLMNGIDQYVDNVYTKVLDHDCDDESCHYNRLGVPHGCHDPTCKKVDCHRNSRTAATINAIEGSRVRAYECVPVEDHVILAPFITLVHRGLTPSKMEQEVGSKFAVNPEIGRDFDAICGRMNKAAQKVQKSFPGATLAIHAGDATGSTHQMNPSPAKLWTIAADLGKATEFINTHVGEIYANGPTLIGSQRLVHEDDPEARLEDFREPAVSSAVNWVTPPIENSSKERAPMRARTRQLKKSFKQVVKFAVVVMDMFVIPALRVPMLEWILCVVKAHSDGENLLATAPTGMGKSTYLPIVLKYAFGTSDQSAPKKVAGQSVESRLAKLCQMIHARARKQTMPEWIKKTAGGAAPPDSFKTLVLPDEMRPKTTGDVPPEEQIWRKAFLEVDLPETINLVPTLSPITDLAFPKENSQFQAIDLPREVRAGVTQATANILSRLGPIYGKASGGDTFLLAVGETSITYSGGPETTASLSDGAREGVRREIQFLLDVGNAIEGTSQAAIGKFSQMLFQIKRAGASLGIHTDHLSQLRGGSVIHMSANFVERDLQMTAPKGTIKASVTSYIAPAELFVDHMHSVQYTHDSVVITYRRPPLGRIDIRRTVTPLGNWADPDALARNQPSITNILAGYRAFVATRTDFKAGFGPKSGPMFNQLKQWRDEELYVYFRRATDPQRGIHGYGCSRQCNNNPTQCHRMAYIEISKLPEEDRIQISKEFARFGTQDMAWYTLNEESLEEYKRELPLFSAAD